MTTNHIDQLEQWWETAERGPVNVGDTVIYQHAGQWIVDVSSVPYDNPDEDDVRILSRAPKPKPAWHDAAAVLANHRDYPDEPRTVWSHDGDPEGYDWNDHSCPMAAPHHLVNVTPLIEAKVTDEMVERLEGHFLNTANMALPEGLARRMLHAALGLETE